MRRAFVLVVVLLSGCVGGGGGFDYRIPDASGVVVEPHGWSKPGRVRRTYPHETGSYSFRGYGRRYIGPDVEPKDALPEAIILKRPGYTVSMGPSRDGVGLWRLLNYEKNLGTNGPSPFRVRPRLWLHTAMPLDLQADVRGSVRILNDILPPEFQIELAGRFSNAEIGGLRAREGTILVAGATPAVLSRECGDALACAKYRTRGDHMHNSLVVAPKELAEEGYTKSRTVIIHELLHALGIRGHVGSTEFPDSIMGTSGDFFPNPGFILHQIDREYLQAMYMNQRTLNYNDYGEWSDTAMHLMARSDDGTLSFGVALYNGLPQPWARGVRPRTDLQDNTLLRGSATWKGALFGFSGVSPITGDTELEIRLGALINSTGVHGDLRFRGISYVNRFDDEDPWFPVRNIDYRVRVGGNSFRNLDGNGFVVGAFMGRNHEGMAGTVKRTDLVGAFGGKR